MEGRASAWLLTLPFALACAGCVNTQTQKTVAPGVSTGITHLDDTPRVVKKEVGPKRNPLPGTEIAYGQMKESEADSEAGKQNPEAQRRLRDEARKAYQHALELDKNNVDAQRCLGRLYVKTGDFERAQDIYKKILTKHPKDAGLWHDFGMYHKSRKDFNECVRCFGKALELDPENPDYLKKLGFSLAWTGQIEKGLVYLTRGAGAATAHYWIGCMFMDKDQRAPAIQHLRHALADNDRRNGALSAGQTQDARELLASLEGPPPTPGRRGLDSPIATRPR
ncbi:MAG: tetratricopeptide repeat protein [Planctomycetes bacterium]|nr:tetratricopeptide repeat protein [Planctomycetota bacterium]